MPHRVLFMISSMHGGGSEQQTLLLLRHLDRAQFEPHLYVTQRAGALLDFVPSDVTVHAFDDAAPSPGVYYPGRALKQQVEHLRDLVSRNGIDVIYDRTFHMTMIAGPATEATHVPRVSTIVSPPHHALPMVESKFVAIKRRRLAKAYRQSRTVVAVSRQAAESAEQYYRLPPKSVKVIQNPVDIQMLRRSAESVEVERDDRLTLVCVGRMTEEKGHRDLIAALHKAHSMRPDSIQSMRLWMIGDGPLRPSLESQAKEALPNQAIEFLGTQQNPASYIASADGLILPSHFEGMPNVVLEAMALGTPVIATRAGGTIELERDKPTISWAEPGDPQSLAEAILKFAEDRDAASTRATDASDLVMDFHDVGKTTRRIEQMLIDAV